jgi:hypothetical protein
MKAGAITLPAPQTSASAISGVVPPKADRLRFRRKSPVVPQHSGQSAGARVRQQPCARPRHRALATYIDRHPRAWERFKGVPKETLGCEITETNTPLPIVELRLDARS